MVKIMRAIKISSVPYVDRSGLRASSVRGKCLHKGT